MEVEAQWHLVSLEGLSAGLQWRGVYRVRVHICSSVLIPQCSVHLEGKNYLFILLIYIYKAFYNVEMGERMGLGVGSRLEPERYN